MFPALHTILHILQAVDLIDEWTVKRYNRININYCKDGFKGILSYKIQTAKYNLKGKQKQ